MNKYALVFLYCLTSMTSFGQSYNLSLNCHSDTNFNIQLGGLLDGNNYQLPHMYVVAGWPDYKHLPVAEPLDSVVVSNTGLTDLTSFKIITQDNNIYKIDGLAQSAIPGALNSTEDSLYKLYRYVADHNFYFFVPEMESREFKEVTRHFGIYGYGHCGSIGNCATLLGKKLFGGGQRLWTINQDSHGISEIYANGKYYYLDADEEMMLKGRNNKNYISFGEAYEDLYLLYRTKPFGAINYYSFPQSVSYAAPRYFNQTSHFFHGSYVNNYNNCYTNDTVGNYGPELYFNLKSGERMKMSQYKDSSFGYHHRPESYCSNGPYGYLPESYTVYPAIQNIQTHYDLFATNQIQTSKFFSQTNVQFNFNEHKVKPTSFSNSIFTVQRLSRFPIIGGQLSVSGTFQDQADSMQIFISFNGTSWLLIKTLTLSSSSALIDLNGFIKPLTSLAKYNVYFRTKFFVNGNLDDAVLNEFNWDLRYQMSRYMHPNLRLGNNQVKLEMSGNLTPSQIQCNLYWKEHSENIPPQPPQYPIFPSNGSTLNKTDIRFQWEQINHDTEGDSIWEWQFQLSEDPGFNTVLANNFDYSSLLKEGNKASFFNYFDTLNARNTFFSNNSTYYWRVRVRDIRNAWSNWSSAWSFTVQAPQPVQNTHFELVSGNKNQLSLRWKNTPGDALTTKYRLLLGANPTSLFLHNNQVTNVYPTASQYLFNVDSSKKAFRVFAMDNADNCSPPAPVITLPELIKHKVEDTMDLYSIMESLQHPFPNYPSLDRNYFLLFDTTYFDAVSASSIQSKQKGRTLVNICYTVEDDTVYKKQLLVQIQDFAILNANCNGTDKYVTIDAPINHPLTVNYHLNGISGSQVLTTASDSLFLAYGDTIVIDKICNNTDTIEIDQWLYNNTLPLTMSWNDLPYNCISNQAQFSVNVTGVAPLLFSYLKDSNQVYDVLNNGSNILSFENGQYDFVEVTDSFQCSLPINVQREYAFDTMSFSAGTLMANCDSLRMELPIQLQGNAPWTIFYAKNGFLTTYQTDQQYDTLPLPNSDYLFFHVSDSTGCIRSIVLDTTINYIPLTVNSDTVAIDCNNNIQYIPIQSNGMYPLTLFHDFNGSADSTMMYTPNHFFYFNNGIHHFNYVKDALGCTLDFVSTYTINQQMLNYSIAQPYYDCDSHKTHLQLNVQGNPPYTVYYRLNGQNKTLFSYSNQFHLWMGNSTYQIDSVRGGTCVMPVNGNNYFHFTYSEPQISISNIKTDCNNDSMYVNYQITNGSLPVQISGYYLGNAWTKTLTSGSGKIYLNPGTYVLTSINDSTGCLQPVAQNLNADLEKLDGEIGEPVYACNSATNSANVTLHGTAPFRIYYRKNLTDSVLIVNSKSFVFTFSNGHYLFDSVQDAFCTTSISTPYNYQFNHSIFTSGVQPLSYNCSNNTSSITISANGGLAPYTLLYTLNGIADSMIINGPNYQWALNSGTYWIQKIHDANHCEQNINTNYTVNNQALQFQLDAPQFNCDSNKSQVPLLLQGNPPYTIYYRQNGLNKSAIANTNQYNFYLPNGSYIFDSVKDQHCSKSFTTGNSFVLNYQLPSTTISNVQYDCNTAQAFVNVSNVNGIAPFTFHFKFNGVSNSLQSNSTSFKWILLNGQYEFVSITDSLQCPVDINQTSQVSFYPLSCQISNPVYICDSNKTRINFLLQGNAPFQIYYRKNNVNQVYTSNQLNTSLMLGNGSYMIDSVRDQTCSYIPPQTLAYTFNYQQFSAQLYALPYQCDSSHHHVQINVTGNPPYQLQYQFNSTAQTQYFSQNTLHKNLVNGNFLFTSITDTAGCSIQLNQNFVINSTPLSWTIQSPVYHCDSNKTRLNFQFNGTPPWKIHYRKNNIPNVLTTGLTNFQWFMNNGNYTIDSISDLYCSKPVTTSNQYNFNYQPLIVSYSTPVYDCDSAKMKMAMTLIGNSPISLYTSLNGFNDTSIVPVSNFNYYFENGQSVIQYVRDATNCTFPIYESYQFNETPLQVSYGIPTYNCSTNFFDLDMNFSGPGPFTLDYIHNGVNGSMLVSTSTTSLQLDEGNWVMTKVTDNKGCIKWLNQPYAIPHTDYLSYLTLSNQYDCSLNKHKTQLALQGNAPYWIYYREVVPQSNQFVINVTSDTATLLFLKGSYIIDSIKDNYSCLLPVNLTVTHILDSLSFSIASQTYDCDSMKQKINMLFTGQGPWTLQYKNLSTNVVNSVLFWQPNATMYLPDGQFELLSISDQTCNLNLSDTISNPILPLELNLSGMNYSCDQKKFYVVIECSGGVSPYTLNYFKNGQPLTLTLSGYDTLYLDNNSDYVLNKVVDNIGCEKNQNDTIQTNYVEPDWQPLTLNYDCNKDSTLVVFHVSSPDSAQLIYEWNQSSTDTLSLDLYPSILVPNGSYHWIQLISKYGCVQVIDSVTHIDEHPNAFMIDSSVMDCSGTNYQYYFSGSGKLPITLHYEKDGLPEQLIFQTSPAVNYFSPGVYHFQQSVDLNGCTNSYNITDTLNSFTQVQLMPELIDQIISLPAIGTNYTWYKNDSIIKTNARNEIIAQGNGTYYAEYLDSAGCLRMSLPLVVSAPLKASVYPNPVIDVLTISFNDRVDFWEFEIRDVAGNKLMEGMVDGSTGSIDVTRLAHGCYYILVRSKTLEQVYRFFKG